MIFKAWTKLQLSWKLKPTLLTLVLHHNNYVGRTSKNKISLLIVSVNLFIPWGRDQDHSWNVYIWYVFSGCMGKPFHQCTKVSLLFSYISDLVNTNNMRVKHGMSLIPPSLNRICHICRNEHSHMGECVDFCETIIKVLTAFHSHQLWQKMQRVVSWKTTPWRI